MTGVERLITEEQQNVAHFLGLINKVVETEAHLE